MQTAITAILPLLFLFAWILCAVGIAVLVLRRRDRIAREEGKTKEQVQASFSALLQFSSTLYRAVPGVLIVVFGIFFAIDRGRQHESDWWIGILFIPVGWVLVPLLARNSWRRYLELKRFAEMTPDDFLRTEPALRDQGQIRSNRDE